MEENNDQIIIPNYQEINDQFPIGLKVLAIDSNIVCLKYLVHLLQKCQYKVTATREAEEALRLLKNQKQGFDIIITNVVRCDMDGFEILRTIGLQTDIPVIMLSANEDLEMVKRGVMEGAEAYLLKPVRLQELSNIWQHVLRRRSRQIIRSFNPNFTDYDNNDNNNNLVVYHQDHEDKNRNLDLDIINDNIINVVSSSSSKKKNRVTWTKELHRKFVQVYDQLPEKERVPNSILKLMNEPRLSREQIASHLQKHRDTLKKKKGNGVGKLVSQKNYNYDRNYNSTRASTIYNSMNQRRNKVSNLIQRNYYEKLTTAATWPEAGSYESPVPEVKWFDNPIIPTLPCDEYLVGFGSHYSEYPLLESKCLDSATQSFGNVPIDNNNNNNVGAIIPNDQAPVPLGWSFPNNYNAATTGQCSQMQFDNENFHVCSSLMDDDLGTVLKQLIKELVKFDIEKSVSSEDLQNKIFN